MLRVNTRLVRHPSDLDEHRVPFTVSQANLNHGETVDFCGVPSMNFCRDRERFIASESARPAAGGRTQFVSKLHIARDLEYEMQLLVVRARRSGLVKRHNIRLPVLTLPGLLLTTGTTSEDAEYRPIRKAWMQQLS